MSRNLHVCVQVSGLSRKNYRNSASELRSLVQTFGLELERHLFRCLLAKVKISPKENTPELITSVPGSTSVEGLAATDTLACLATALGGERGVSSRVFLQQPSPLVLRAPALRLKV